MNDGATTQGPMGETTMPVINATLDLLNRDGGPVHPVEIRMGPLSHDDPVITHRGMTLRDEFAGHAIQGLAPGLLTAVANVIAAGGDEASAVVESRERGAAIMAYRLADAMLKAREDTR